jgi:hypothetical protein
MYFVHSHVSPDRAWNESYIDSYPIRIRFPLDGANHIFDTRPNRIRSPYDYHVLMTC